MVESGKWYGFDLDGTIADNTHHPSGFGSIGKPIRPMVELMKKFNKSGKRVKIFTARLSDAGDDEVNQYQIKKHIWEWCDEHLGFRPEITDRKDFQMECLYDDRARQVVTNDGHDMKNIASLLATALYDLLNHPNRKVVQENAENLLSQCEAWGIPIAYDHT